MSTQMQASRLQILDIIRGVAIFAVVAVHVDQIATKIVVDTGIEFNETAITSTLAPYGRYGVELFFVLSGFLMSMIYYKRSSESQINVRKFLSRRARRIYPLWIAFFIIGIIESYVVGFGG
jgi:peptidoglycan/LPS O-acetylase OafA/YrhL